VLVAAIGTLDLDQVGVQIREDQRPGWAGDDMAEFQDFEVLKGRAGMRDSVVFHCKSLGIFIAGV